ncbi:SDR family oxidoreductase [Amycolatopsis rhabdoformis]|uniref:SDR family oxidoreductase n=1 Tax=Amycolatopsis rhabdoformis TaxID=1448059 RepID=A0ABZ1HYZ2_9PSEU|nr:SDR family oxidoreductase [Amycolatopsis rhabdoformis]WSE27372.1 SDR family oxidoreductase [Amycolatopsis rhabdoformis]
MKTKAGGQRGAVVVAGASAGFGPQVTRVLAERGFTVIALVRRGAQPAGLARNTPDRCVIPVAVDVGDRAALDRALKNVPADCPEVVALVNNAGLSRGFGPLHGADPRHWRDLIDPNLRGLFNVTAAVVPGLVEQGHGHVVTIGSIAAEYPVPGSTGCGPTRTFVQRLNLGLSADLEGSGVRVSCIAPGPPGALLSHVQFDGAPDHLPDGVEALAAGDVAEAVARCLTLPVRLTDDLGPLAHPTKEALDRDRMRTQSHS